MWPRSIRTIIYILIHANQKTTRTTGENDNHFPFVVRVYLYGAFLKIRRVDFCFSFVCAIVS